MKDLQNTKDNLKSYDIYLEDKYYTDLRADCAKCFGLCCVALYYSASEGFPSEKEVGQPCINLQPDFSCSVHESLMELGLKGCIGFDCFGAGQKVAQLTFGGDDWKKNPHSAKQMYDVFQIMRQLHEMLWYLNESLTLKAALPIHEAISTVLLETRNFTQASPDLLMKLDVVGHRNIVSALLIKTSELVRAGVCGGPRSVSRIQNSLATGIDFIGVDLRKKDLRAQDLRGAYLIAADLRGVNLSRTDLIGADFRDADLRGADLSESIFLTQAQINSAKGNINTKLPMALIRPAHWKV